MKNIVSSWEELAIQLVLTKQKHFSDHDIPVIQISCSYIVNGCPSYATLFPIKPSILLQNQCSILDKQPTY
jgi:hypothetical protein